MPIPDRSACTDGVDAVLASWCQGDCVLDGDHWFAHRVDVACPLTAAGHAAAAQRKSIAEEKVAGFVVITQTCDIVRACNDRPYLEVCPLVAVDEQCMKQVQRGRHPKYACLPGLAKHGLVAHLDRVMTVEKPIVARWTRVPGCETDQEARCFAKALVRKHARFAFPDDFTLFAKKLRDRWIGKHDKTTAEGRALRALQEIRVRAEPSWNAEQIDLVVWFIQDSSNSVFDDKDWTEAMQTWRMLVPPSGRFRSVRLQRVALENISAKDFLDSDPFDLDHLSTAFD
ncbi:MAG: hypothetical protein FWD57_14970 [Polyangiaceae bacterium]|nr:hypothetical protein [Polyangiaceae bacterium]